MTTTTDSLFHIVPAGPGWRCLYIQDDGSLFVGGAIFAWRIESDQHASCAAPIGAGDLDPNGNLWGYLRPDCQVETGDNLFGSLDEAVACAQAERSGRVMT